ncbi:Hemolysin transporter protein ShlB precursor [compost metagenome]
MSNPRRWLLGFALLDASFANAAPLFSLGDRDLQRERQEQLLREQQQRLDQLQQLPGRAAPKAAPEQAPDTRCFTVREITLEGADHLDAANRERLLEPYRGQCLGVSQLNALLKAITYLDRGLVTSRAYLPQQDLSSGKLKIIVVEGRLEGFDDSAVTTLRELRMVFPGQVGEPLQLRELEQLIDQVNRLPSRQAQLELVPGSEVGGSRAELKGAQTKPWRVSALFKPTPAE